MQHIHTQYKDVSRLHEYWILSMRVLRSPLWVATQSHLEHGYFTPTSTSNMNLQHICESRNIITLLTRIYYLFVFTFYVKLQVICCSSSIITFRTRISHSFMFTFNKSPKITVVAIYSQSEHGYLTPSCLSLICDFGSPFWDAVTDIENMDI